MQRSAPPTRVSFSKRRYTPPLFMSKKKPLMSTEQLMEEIMHGTRDLPVNKKPLSATIAKLDNDQMHTLSPFKSPVSTASTLTMTEHSSESSGSTVIDANKMPPAPVLLNSTKQSDTISPLSTPFASPVSSSLNSRSRKNGRYSTSSVIGTKHNIHLPLELQDAETQSNMISPSSLPSNPSVLPPKSRSRRAQPHSKTPVSARRSLGNIRALSARMLQQSGSQVDQAAETSIPPVPSLQAEDDQQETRTNNTARTHSRSPISRRRKAAGARTPSARKPQRTPSQDNQAADPSVPPETPLQTKDTIDGQLETTGTTAQTRSKSPVRTHSRSPRRRKVTIARTPQRTLSQDDQATDPSVPPVPPLQAKDAADGKLETTGTTAQITRSKSPVRTRSKSPRKRKVTNARKPRRTPSEDNQVSDPSIPPALPLQAKNAADGRTRATRTTDRTHSKSPRRRKVTNARTPSARKPQSVPSEDNQAADPSVPPEPPLQAKDAGGGGGGDHQPVLVSTRISMRANRRRNHQRNSKLLSALLNDNDDSAQGQRLRSSRSTCSRDPRTTTKKEASSSHSICAPSLERLQPNTTTASTSGARNNNNNDTPKRRRMTLDERKLRSTTSQMMMGSRRTDRQSRSRNSFPDVASSSKAKNDHPSGFIKSFCGTSVMTEEEHVSPTEKDATDDNEES